MYVGKKGCGWLTENLVMDIQNIAEYGIDPSLFQAFWAIISTQTTTTLPGLSILSPVDYDQRFIHDSYDP